MSQHHEGRTKSYRAAGAIPACNAVALDANGRVAIAADKDAGIIGFTIAAAYAEDDLVTVDLIGSGGTFKGITATGQTITVADRLGVTAGEIVADVAGYLVAEESKGANEHIEVGVPLR